jgi:hypothetical protein
MTPDQSRKTAVTCLLIIFVLGTAGLGLIPIAIWALVRHRHRQHQPDSVAAQLIAQARVAPDLATSVGLLHTALDTDPLGAGTLAACADWYYTHQCWADAADAYAGYFHVASSTSYEINYAVALISAGHVDDALTELQHLLNQPLDESDHDDVLSQLALVFMIKGDPSQGLAFANQANLRKQNLSAGAKRSLMMRASCRYLLGQRAKAREDLDRLYALSASDEISDLKSRMAAGTFQLEAPKPYPDWYPTNVQVMEGPTVDEVPDEHADALANGDLSPDGRWRWTGSEWAEASLESTTDESPALGGSIRADDRSTATTAAMAAASVDAASGTKSDQIGGPTYTQGPPAPPEADAVQTDAGTDPVQVAETDSHDRLTQSSAPTLQQSLQGIFSPPGVDPQEESRSEPSNEASMTPIAAGEAVRDDQQSNPVGRPAVSEVESQTLQPDAARDSLLQTIAEHEPTLAASGSAEWRDESGTHTSDGLVVPDTGDSRYFFSADGAWWWNRTTWVSAYSEDRLWHWNGKEWEPVGRAMG